MIWHLSSRFDRRALPLADRHYNRQKPGTPQFVPPGRCVVLLTANSGALWVTSWQKFVQHRWPGAWVCSCFRRESGPSASDMIRDAVAATGAVFGPPPRIGMITFIDRNKVRPTMVRGQRIWGWTYIKAVFEPDGETQGGLLALRMRPENMPPPESPIGYEMRLFR